MGKSKDIDERLTDLEYKIALILEKLEDREKKEKKAEKLKELKERLSRYLIGTFEIPEDVNVSELEDFVNGLETMSKILKFTPAPRSTRLSLFDSIKAYKTEIALTLLGITIGAVMWMFVW